MPDPTLTDQDLARLLTFVTLHKGHLPDVPQGVIPTFQRLSIAELVTLDEVDSPAEVGGWPASVDYESRITPLGTRVAEGMLEAGRATLSGLTLDIPEPMV
jgi:hypothetical protein